MSQFTALAQQYVDIWNTTDSTKRRELVERLFTPEATFTDPLASVEGWDGIDAFVDGAQQQLGGMSLKLAGQVDGHHDICRFTWQAGPDDAEPVVIGFDVLVTDGDGKVSDVYGFLDKMPG